MYYKQNGIFKYVSFHIHFMKQSIIKLSDIEKKFLISLLEDGRKTNSQIAKEINISKATAGRIRNSLEKRDIISEYIPIVDLDKIGINVFLVAMLQWTGIKSEKLNMILSELERDPHVIFLANGEGSEGLTTSLFLGFKDIEDYHRYFNNFRKKYSEYMGKIVTLILPSKEIIKEDFTHLVKYMLKGGGNLE